MDGKFAKWAGNCCYLVSDYERFLPPGLSVRAYAKTSLDLVEGYPRSSQDSNAIKNAWRVLKEYLDMNMPTRRETRDEFIIRLRAAVSWANRNRSQQLWSRNTNQKERADECLATKPPGGRTRV